MRIVIQASLARSLISFRGPLVQALRGAGCEVFAIAPGLLEDGKTRQQLEDWGVIVHDVALDRAGANPLRDIRTLVSFYRLLREIKPDSVLSYTIKPVIYGTLAARFGKVPKRFVLITGLGYAFTGEAHGKRGLVQRLIRFLYRQALKGTQIIFFQNPDDEALFRKLELTESSVPSMIVNGSGIDTSSFSVISLPSKTPRFLLIARLLGDKGVREYVAAAASIRERYPNAIFRLVGDIDANPDSISRHELDRWIKERHIEYLGWLDDVRPAIADANVYVLPSYREGTPRTVLEAMSMGRAVITTDAPGCRETVVEGENGFLVPVKSVGALVAAMEKFFLEPKLISKMGERSRQIAVEKYDVHKVNAVMLEAMGVK